MSFLKLETPVKLGGVTITEDLLQALDDLKDRDNDTASFFTEQCLMISSIEVEDYGIDRSLFSLFYNLYRIIRALEDTRKGGAL